MEADFFARLNEQYSVFSKGQKKIADYISENYDKSAYMTAGMLGKTVGVSESTVVRFATELGYEGYPELQRALREIIKNKLTTVQRMSTVSTRWGDNILDKVLKSDIDSIKKTIDEIDTETFSKAVNAITKAKRIYIVGIRSASALAGFMSHYFTQIFDDVRNIDTSSTSAMFEQLYRINREDVFIGITFPRYSKRTLKAADYAYSKGATVISITDSQNSPIAEFSDTVLVAKSEMASFVDSLVAPLSLINALIVAIGLEKKDEIVKTYENLENIWEEYNVYETQEKVDNIND